MGADLDAVASRLLVALRRLAPAVVRVVDAQGDTRDVAVPSRRKRWSQAVETIIARPWVHAVLLDAKGRELGHVENDGPAEDLEELGGAPTSRIAESRWIVEMMIKSQQVALTYRDKEHTALLQSVQELLQVHTQAMREMYVLMREQRDVAADLAAMRAQAEQGDDMDKIVKMIEASPKLAQTLAPIMMALRAGGPRPPQQPPPRPPQQPPPQQPPPPAKPKGK